MNDDILAEFIVEGYENLDRIDSDLLALERGEPSADLLASVFRSMHTIKGTCGFLGLALLEKVAHRSESLLSLLRDSKIPATQEIFSVLLRSVDALRSILQNLESTELEGEDCYGELVAELEYIAQHGKVRDVDDMPAPEAKTESAEDVAEPPPPPPFEGPSLKAVDALPQPAEPEPLPVASSEPAPKPAESPIVELQPSVVNLPNPESAAEPAKPQTISPTSTMASSESSRTPAANSASSSESTSKASLADSTIRVDVELLDRVMNLVGELVLARNRILQFAPQLEDPSFANASQRLNLLTTELQEGVMKTRMQPIGNVWNKFPRMVRDLCRSCGKEVELELDGVETELDRTIIEAIKDPLTHVVRNAIDHGIESPNLRMERGKRRKGRLMLRAYHEGGQVNIEVSDDGGGLNVDKIRERAIDRGLVTAERAKHLSNKEIFGFIFNAGFSTAAKVTNVSGRGVGMDVVKTNIEKIGGSVDISSVSGSGTTLKVKIPLTLAIIPALTVTCREERFAIPQVNLLELVRLEGEQALEGIERAFGATMYRLRGDLLPLLYLDECLGLCSGERDPNEVLNIVVLQADERQFGVVVDSIRDTEEIVVKPLGKELKSIPAFAGATIMGDGQVALILDVLGLAERARLVCGEKHRLASSSEAISMFDNEESESLLLFSVGENARMAIQLSMVTRIEEIPVGDLEYAGDQLVVQYRGQILPLIDLRSSVGYRQDSTESGALSVIVYSQGEHATVGFVVEKILDAVEETLRVKRDSTKPGTLGSAVIQGCVTDLLDVPGVLRSSSVQLASYSEAA